MAVPGRPGEAVAFWKGHGTENDFLLLPDPDGTLLGALSPELAARLCDRRAGIGADGVIRVVRTDGYDDPWAVSARDAAEWFMDYRNADGSRSQMCGNGIRVLARYLAAAHNVPTDRALFVGTRSGVKRVVFEPDGQISVDMGSPQLLAETEVAVPGHTWQARHVSMGNPHAVAFVERLEDAGDLSMPPSHDPGEFPEGVNVEFVVRRGTHHLAMRVHERGSGETRSCGTGACAAMVAAAQADDAGRGVTYRVDVPGGALAATWTEDDAVRLTGPAVLVAEGRWRSAG